MRRSQLDCGAPGGFSKAQPALPVHGYAKEHSVPRVPARPFRCQPREREQTRADISSAAGRKSSVALSQFQGSTCIFGGFFTPQSSMGITTYRKESTTQSSADAQEAAGLSSEASPVA